MYFLYNIFYSFVQLDFPFHTQNATSETNVKRCKEKELLEIYSEIFINLSILDEIKIRKLDYIFPERI